jgi:hypothetical protein
MHKRTLLRVGAHTHQILDGLEPLLGPNGVFSLSPAGRLIFPAASRLLRCSRVLRLPRSAIRIEWLAASMAPLLRAADSIIPVVVLLSLAAWLFGIGCVQECPPFQPFSIFPPFSWAMWGTFCSLSSHTILKGDANCLLSASLYSWFIFSPLFFTFSPPSIRHSFFFQWDSRIRKNCFKELHHQFWRNTSLTKSLQLEYQYLQSYHGLFQNLARNFEEEHHNFADIEIQAEVFESNLYFFKKLMMQPLKTVSLDSAMFIEKKRWPIDCGEKVKTRGEQNYFIFYSR